MLSSLTATPTPHSSHHHAALYGCIGSRHFGQLRVAPSNGSSMCSPRESNSARLPCKGWMLTQSGERHASLGRLTP